MRLISVYSVVILLMMSGHESLSQATVFQLLSTDLHKADEHFNNKSYYQALKYYEISAKGGEISSSTLIKMAECNYFLKRFNKAIEIYDLHISKGKDLPLEDIYFYAEAQTGLLNYDKAKEYYNKYLELDPDNELVIRKIWRIDNRQYLFEDSSSYSVKYLPINTPYSEFRVTPYKSGIVFVTNRGEPKLISRKDASTNTSFYKPYFSQIKKDFQTNQIEHYGKPVVFINELYGRYHDVPVAFYENESKMIFTSSGTQGKTLKLFFAQKSEAGWVITGSFPHNSEEYSISDPSISEDGKMLYFTSDKRDGIGGKDIYSSFFIEGKWQEPENLGLPVNTPYDEAFPYFHNDILYFSSTGHAGLGGYDIFRVNIKKNVYKEVENMGYPINTNGDDFGIVFDSLDNHGYLSSNRKNGGFDDDIYEIEMDIQQYPLNISGTIKYKEYNWTDTSEIKVLANARLYLIDNKRNISVTQTESDKKGNFSFEVPYYSNEFKLRVMEESVGEGIVSFVVPKYRRKDNRYEVVVVKDEFSSKKEGKNE